jgi:hypothetical protein
MTVPTIPLAQVQSVLTTQAQALPPNTALATQMFGFDTATMTMTTNNATSKLLTAFDASLIAYDAAIRDSGKRYWGTFEKGLVDAASAPGGGLYTAVFNMVTNIIATELK